MNQREIRTDKRISNSGKRRGSSRERAARNDVRAMISGQWVDIKIYGSHSKAHHL